VLASTPLAAQTQGGEVREHSAGNSSLKECKALGGPTLNRFSAPLREEFYH